MNRETCPWKDYVIPPTAPNKSNSWHVGKPGAINEVQTNSETMLKIYTYFNFTDLFSSNSLQGTRQSQQKEGEIADVAGLSQAELSAIVAEMSPYFEIPVKSDISTNDIRPYLFDKAARKSILVDSGAMLSCWPYEPSLSLKPTSIKLKAVNKSSIKTYGI